MKKKWQRHYVQLSDEHGKARVIHENWRFSYAAILKQNNKVILCLNLAALFCQDESSRLVLTTLSAFPGFSIAKYGFCTY